MLQAMRNLRFAYFWLSGGIALLAGVLYLTLVPVGGSDIGTSDKLVHLLVFVVLMVWFCGVFRLARAPQVALGLLAFGILIEFLQGLTSYRSTEMADAAFDFVGILIGWSLAAAGLGQWARVLESRLPDRAT